MLTVDQDNRPDIDLLSLNHQMVGLPVHSSMNHRTASQDLALLTVKSHIGVYGLSAMSLAERDPSHVTG